jgi:hypothetical protein
LLSQGGEFAFVLLSLANELKVLPTDLNRLLIIVVVLSMALTPFLAEAGKRFADSTLEEDAEGEAPFDFCFWHHHFQLHPAWADMLWMWHSHPPT